MFNAVSAALAAPGKNPINNERVKPITANILIFEIFVWVLLIFFYSKYESRCTRWCCNFQHTPNSCEFEVFKEEMHPNKVFNIQKYFFAKKSTKSHKRLVFLTFNLLMVKLRLPYALLQ